MTPSGLYNWYFCADVADRSVFRAILWWELRRILFNILMAIVGFPSLILFFIFAHASIVVRPGEDIVEPISILFAPIAFNVCYTFGWIVELIANKNPENKGHVSPIVLLKLGTGISLTLALLPAVITGIIFVFTKLGLMEATK